VFIVVFLSLCLPIAIRPLPFGSVGETSSVNPFRFIGYAKCWPKKKMRGKKIGYNAISNG
jgi:hypothetical protein